MNATQTKYAMQRLEEAAKEKESRIHKETEQERAPGDRERMKAIHDGSAVLRRERAIPGEWVNAFSLFDFPGEQERNANNLSMEESRERRMVALKGEVRRLKDQVMLGDAEEVLKMLAEFSEKEF